MGEKRILLDFTLDELRAQLVALGQPAFRAKQVFAWLHKGAAFEEMRNLPKALREALAQAYVDMPLSIHQVFPSQRDDTVKFLFSLGDGHLVEGVLMHYHYGYTLCISTQVGCRMGCRFCASTLEGCVRNLSAGEMLAQVLLANRYLAGQGHVGHVVMMGSGEPLDNYLESVRFLRLVNHSEGLGLSLRNISLSTCGLVPQMRQLAGEGLPITLSVSLHGPNDAIRSQLMPIANRYPMEQLMHATRAYVQQTGRRVVFEYALVDGLNSQPCHAQELASLVGGLQCHVNLIPLNPVKEIGSLRPADRATVDAFLQVLEKRHISATCRREMGTDIGGACGQLRRHLKTGEKLDTIATNNEAL